MAAVAAELSLDLKTSRFVQQFDRFLERQGRRWAAPAMKILIDEGRRAAKAYESQGEAAALAAVRDAPWQSYLYRVWLATVPRAGELVTEGLAKAGPPDVFMQAAVRWLRLNAADRVAGITDTSRDEIGNQIRIGVSKGEGREQIAARIVKHRRSIAPDRAMTIARTEVHAAANYGALTAAGEIRVPMKKIWINRAGARPAHAAAGGQRRPLDEAFTVGGYALMFPGDSSGGAPAAMTVNCRCIQSFEAARRPARPRVAA